MLLLLLLLLYYIDVNQSEILFALSILIKSIPQSVIS